MGIDLFVSGVVEMHGDNNPEKSIGSKNSAEKDTKDYKNLTLNVALSYGGRQEILNAARLLAEDAKNAMLNPADIDEKMFSGRLYTAGQPDPDLLIRTSGEMRISNFLLWQISYAELYVTETLWPDFRYFPRTYKYISALKIVFVKLAKNGKFSPDMTNLVARHLRDEYNMAVGELTVENIKTTIGSAYRMDPELKPSLLNLPVTIIGCKTLQNALEELNI